MSYLSFVWAKQTAKLQSPLFTWVERLDMSITVTEFPQLAHTESSNTNSVRTGCEPRLTHPWESAFQRSSTRKRTMLDTTVYKKTPLTVGERGCITFCDYILYLQLKKKPIFMAFFALGKKKIQLLSNRYTSERSHSESI